MPIDIQQLEKHRPVLMTNSRNNGILLALFFILVAAFQGNAVMKRKWVTAEADTVYLPIPEVETAIGWAGNPARQRLAKSLG